MEYNNRIPKFSIITPCFNAERYITETIQSVIEQSAVVKGLVELEYIIVDGNSTDNTKNIILSFDNPSIKIISEPDKGMYDALSKGFKLISGDVTGYINAGDYYSKYAFEVVSEIFNRPDIFWLTGMTVFYNERSHFVGATLPFRYRSNFIRKGIYGHTLPYIQQESTFWKTFLNSSIDFDFFSSFRFAGDYYLWAQFSKQTELYIAEAYLGGFKIHSGQLSQDISKYNKEVDRTIKSNPNLFDKLHALIDKLIWSLPLSFKKRFNRKYLLRFNHKTSDWE
jgi:glycosyltransferase involved in cell wall biosynthesis